MTERETIALLTDTLKSVREAIIYTFPPGNLSTELYNRVNLALGIGLDKLNEKNNATPKAPRRTKG